GFRAYESRRAAQKFLEHDEESLRELTAQRRDVGYLSAVRRRIEDLERMLRADRDQPGLSRDAGWDAESLREEFGRKR
ncbi:MAG: potassium transporter, partial [Acidobacteria bacterium]|nr:potassium transporter [Acidobacteriota bacterium]